MSERRCLGIDTGARHPAWGVVGDRRGAAVIAWGMLDADGQCEALAGLVRIYQPTVVALEVITTVHLKGGIWPTYAFSLYETGIATGELKREARALGVPVDTFSAELWRKRLIGKPNPDVHEIERGLRLKLPGFPAPGDSNAHKRDALGVSFCGLLRWLDGQRLAS